MNLQKLELKISRFLRGGLFFAGMMLVVGWVGMLFRHGDNLSTFNQYHQQSLWENLQWAFVMNDRSMVLAYGGLLVLVLLPVLRVLMTSFLFIKTRERLLAVMAFTVFLTLIASFFLGIEL